MVPASAQEWAVLYTQHRDLMYRAARQQLRSAGLADYADDVVHDAMVSLMASPPTSPVMSWPAVLVTVVKRKAIDMIRSAAVRHSAPGATLEDAADPLLDIVDEVAAAVDAEREGAQVWDALAVLEPRERQILGRHKGLGEPRDQVAKDFGISPGRVSQICTAAMRKLEQKLRAEGVQW